MVTPTAYNSLAKMHATRATSGPYIFLLGMHY
jgi:hypothetical protein